MQSNCYTQIYYFLADIFISRKEFCMGKSTKTYEERIQEKDLRIEKLPESRSFVNGMKSFGNALL